jgi:hypothetical protein
MYRNELGANNIEGLKNLRPTKRAMKQNMWWDAVIQHYSTQRILIRSMMPIILHDGGESDRGSCCDVCLASLRWSTQPFRLELGDIPSMGPRKWLAVTRVLKAGEYSQSCLAMVTIKLDSRNYSDVIQNGQYAV